MAWMFRKEKKDVKEALQVKYGKDFEEQQLVKKWCEEQTQAVQRNGWWNTYNNYDEYDKYAKYDKYYKYNTNSLNFSQSLISNYHHQQPAE